MPVQRFRTKIVEIEAMRVEATVQAYAEMKKWTENNFRAVVVQSEPEEVLPNHFLFGPDRSVFQVYDKLHQTWINVAPGMWIVRGAKGEFYPCDDETFHWKYEEVLPKRREKEWKTSTGPGD